MSARYQIPIIDDLFELYQKPNDKPWLIVGKGPSFSMYTLPEKGRPYNIISLNETIRRIEVELCHMIDMDVLARSQRHIKANAKFLVLPYYPHFKHRPNPALPIERILMYEWFPTLNQFHKEGRLFCYNLSTVPENLRRGKSPVIRAFNYSAEAVVNILAELGVKTIRTAGIDGGYEQSKIFDDLANTNLERGYDKQWGNIRRCIKTYNLDYAPFDVESPIRVFVGCSESEEIPFQVLKYSIEKTATMSVKVEPLSRWMHCIPQVDDPQVCSRTPFSFQRFLIPFLCEHKGKAIYLDSDMLVFSDIKDLWNRREEAQVLTPLGEDMGRRKTQFSVMLLNCSKLDWKIEEITKCLNEGLFSYSQIMHEMILASSIHESACPEWNSLERYVQGETKLLHYTDFHTQPWKIDKHPLGYLWENAFREAHKRGYVSTELVRDHIDKGFVRASLLSLLEQNFPHPQNSIA